MQQQNTRSSPQSQFLIIIPDSNLKPPKSTSIYFKQKNVIHNTNLIPFSEKITKNKHLTNYDLIIVIITKS